MGKSEQPICYTYNKRNKKCKLFAAMSERSPTDTRGEVGGSVVEAGVGGLGSNAQKYLEQIERGKMRNSSQQKYNNNNIQLPLLPPPPPPPLLTSSQSSSGGSPVQVQLVSPTSASEQLQLFSVGEPRSKIIGNNNTNISQKHSSSGDSLSTSSNSPLLLSKRAKRVRRNHHKRISRAQLHLRRVAQAAPNNNNEFLMQEHDQLYNFEHQYGSADEDGNRTNLGDVFYIQGGGSSSPDDEEEFLTRDFSNAYDVVHAERLNSMSKIELIQEYQLLEERVETLERKIRSRHSLQQIQTGSGSPFHSTTSRGSTFTSECIPINGGLKLLEEELKDLREENRKLRHENKILGTLRQLTTTETVEQQENENDME